MWSQEFPPFSRTFLSFVCFLLYFTGCYFSKVLFGAGEVSKRRERWTRRAWERLAGFRAHTDVQALLAPRSQQWPRQQHPCPRGFRSSHAAFDFRSPRANVWGILLTHCLEDLFLLISVSMSCTLFSVCLKVICIICHIKKKNNKKPSVTPSKNRFLLSNSSYFQFSSLQSVSSVWLLATPWTAAHQASLSITNSWSLLKLKSIKLMMPSKYLILCCPLLLLPPIPPRIRVFSSESTLRMRWPKYWSFSFSISPSNEYSELISFRMNCLDLLAVQGTLKNLLQHYIQKQQFFGTQLSL